MNTDKLMEAVKGFVPPKGYRLWTNEMDAIQETAHGDVALGLLYAFSYGFMKGQRAAKAEAKRERKKLLERDTSGWYWYLRRWLDRNIDNVRLLELVGVFARSLEKAAVKRKGEEKR